MYRAPPHVPAHDHMVGWGLGEVFRGSHGVLTMGQWDTSLTIYWTGLRETFHFLFRFMGRLFERFWLGFLSP